VIKRVAPWVGMTGTLVFVLSFVLHGLLRPDYDPVKMYVSELSLGPHGWIQIVNFMALGICLVLFALGVRKSFPAEKGSNLGPALLIIIGVCYFISGPLVTDPRAMFEYQQSISGLLHGIFGALVFSLSPICCYVFWRRFRKDAKWRPIRLWTLLSAILMVIIVVIMKIAQPEASVLNKWAGLIQRCSLIAFYAWIFAFSLKLISS